MPIFHNYRDKIHSTTHNFERHNARPTIWHKYPIAISTPLYLIKNFSCGLLSFCCRTYLFWRLPYLLLIPAEIKRNNVPTCPYITLQTTLTLYLCVSFTLTLSYTLGSHSCVWSGWLHGLKSCLKNHLDLSCCAAEGICETAAYQVRLLYNTVWLYCARKTGSQTRTLHAAWNSLNLLRWWAGIF